MSSQKEKNKISKRKLTRSETDLYQTKEWKNLREQKLNLNPFCEKCNATANLHIDHIWEHQNNKDLFFEINNLMTLCRTCHFAKTMKDKELSKFPTNENFNIFLMKKNWNEVGYLKYVYKTDLKSILGHLIKKMENKSFPQSEYRTFEIPILDFTIYEFKTLIDMMIERYKSNVGNWYVKSKSFNVSNQTNRSKPLALLEVKKWVIKIQNEKN